MFKRRRPPTRKRYYRRRALTRRPADGVPKQLFVKQRYVDRYDSTTVAIASYVIYPYANSLYDPYSGAGGHQPMYYDQYTAMYNSWVVMGIAYTIQINPYSGAGTFVVFPTRDSYTPLTISSAMEQKGARSIELNAATGVRNMKGYMSIAKLFALTPKQILADDSFWGSALAGPTPTSTGYLKFMFFSNAGGAFTFSANVHLTYYAKYFQVKNLAPS